MQVIKYTLPRNTKRRFKSSQKVSTSISQTLRPSSLTKMSSLRSLSSIPTVHWLIINLPTRLQQELMLITSSTTLTRQMLRPLTAEQLLTSHLEMLRKPLEISRLFSRQTLQMLPKSRKILMSLWLSWFRFRKLRRRPS